MLSTTQFNFSGIGGGKGFGLGTTLSGTPLTNEAAVNNFDPTTIDKRKLSPPLSPPPGIVPVQATEDDTPKTLEDLQNAEDLEAAIASLPICETGDMGPCRIGTSADGNIIVDGMVLGATTLSNDDMVDEVGVIIDMAIIGAGVISGGAGLAAAPVVTSGTVVIGSAAATQDGLNTQQQINDLKLENEQLQNQVNDLKSQNKK